MSLESSAAQIFDKLVDIVSGPVRGTVTTTATPDVTLQQGQLATLPDGRRVRVIRTSIVTSTSTPVPVRLEWLSPTYPAKANFAAVAAATVATWLSPPAGLSATGTTNAFQSGSQAANIRVGSVVGADQADDPAEDYAAGANGDVRCVLFDGEVDRIAAESNEQRMEARVLWVLRVNFGTLEQLKDVRVRANTVFDRLCASLMGASVGEDVVSFVSWKRATKSGLYSRNLTFATKELCTGRINSAPQTTQPAFSRLDATITVPGDADQPSPFRVETQNPTS